MIRIRRVYSTVAPADEARVQQVQEIFRAHFATVAEYAEKIPDLLNHPFRYGYAAVLLVAERDNGGVAGFALILHFPEVNCSMLDYMAVAPKIRGGGIGGALYEATREYVHDLGSRGLYMEVQPDDPKIVKDPATLDQNRRRLRFYEQYGVRPIVNTAYETPLGESPAPHLLFDGLGRDKPLGRDEARSSVRVILDRKYARILPPGYIDRVVQSFTDEPVQVRPPRYVKAPTVEVSHGRLLKSFALVASEGHEIHHVRDRGYVERPARVGAILEGLAPTDLFDRLPAKHFGEAEIRAVHDGDFVTYLKVVCEKLPRKSPVYPYVFPIRRPERKPKDLSVRAGYYCIDTFTPLDRGAYHAARAAVDVALTAAEEVLAGRRVAYALCRPPGHHAGRRTFGGFCYFSNAAIAANHLSRFGTVAMLDIDYHHGNGQQDIFYQRRDVLTVSIHGNPNIAYPYFSGFVDEVGEGEGKGFNRNFPLIETADDAVYLDAFEKAVKTVEHFAPKFLVVCLGLDTLRGDPTGSFSLTTKAMGVIGRRLGGLGLPLLVVQEGGYNLRNLKRGAPALFQGIAKALAEKFV